MRQLQSDAASTTKIIGVITVITMPFVCVTCGGSGAMFTVIGHAAGDWAGIA